MIDATRLASVLDEDVVSQIALSGGDLSEVVRLTLASGRTAVCKTGKTASAEAEMLRSMAEAGAPAPAVLAVSDDLLILQDLGHDSGLGEVWGDLGLAVRRLHETTGAGYGWPRDHSFGSVEILNDPAPTWPEFWAERRLRPGVRHLPSELARRVERLCDRLPDRLPHAPPAALLHGDLWSGNVIASGHVVAGLD